MLGTLWFLAALTAAVSRSAYSALQKRLTEEHDTLKLSFVTSLMGFVFVLPVGLWFFLQGSPPISWEVAGATFVSGVVNVVALAVTIEALSLEDLSIVAPLQRLTPIMVAFLEPVVLGADLSQQVYLAAAAAAAGSYLILSDSDDLLAPVKNLSRRGAQLALVAAVLYTITSLADRFATSRMSPYVFTVLVYVVMVTGFGALLHRREGLPSVEELLQKKFILLGLLIGGGSVLIFLSFSLAAAARVVTVLQVTIPVSVLLGGYVFEEERIVQRLAGSGLIILAVYLAI
ncbi:MAG: EamA family transporter [Candidatus Nanohaloarchaea archaeon]